MSDILTVGIVLKPLGIRGEIKIMPYTDTLQDFLRFKTLTIGGTDYAVMSARATDNAAAVYLKGIADRNAAELLRQMPVTVKRSGMPKLEKGRYYIADITGCAVFTSTGEQLGVVTDVTASGAADIFTVKDGDIELMFPHLNNLVISVDTESKKIVVDKKRFEEVAVKS